MLFVKTGPMVEFKRIAYDHTSDEGSESLYR